MNSNISTKLSEEEKDVEKDFGEKNTILLPNAKCFFWGKKSIFHKTQLNIEGENDN